MLKKQIIKQVKNNLTLNNSLELEENISIEAKGKGCKFTSKFIEAGVAYYEEFGDVLITKETLDKFINTIIGCPVIIKHKNIDDSNADKERVGVISEVWFNEDDGWFYCGGIIWDKQAIDLVKNQGWSVSCTYDFESDFENKIHNGKKIDMEFINGEFLHLALVENPRYERANIVMNAKDNDDLEWITVKGNHIPIKKGQSKDEAVKEWIDSKDKEEIKEDKKEDKSKNLKQQQLDIILKENPMRDDYHTGIRNIEDIKTFEEAIEDDESFTWGDFDKKEAIEALKSGFVTVYSSKPIKNGGFVSTSKNQSRDYAGNGKIYEKKVAIKDIAWINGDEGQYAKIKEKTNSTDNTTKEQTMNVLNELTEFVKNIINNSGKEKEMSKEEKIKDLLKDKVDEETIQNVLNALEEEKEEKREEKEEKFEEEKELAENKCKNEDDEKEEEKQEVKNSMEMVNRVINNSFEVENSLYMSQSKRIELGNNY